MSTKFLLLLTRVLGAISIPLVSLLHWQLNCYRDGVLLVDTALDHIIPFNALFVIPYLYFHLFMAASITYFAYIGGSYFWRMIVSLNAGTIISCIIFYLYPTTVIRPILSGEGFLLDMVRMVYSMDNPYDCFPSLHVLHTHIMTYFLIKQFSNTLATVAGTTSFLLISLSTVFIKQHSILDVLAAMMLGLMICPLTKFLNKSSRTPDLINQTLIRKHAILAKQKESATKSN